MTKSLNQWARQSGYADFDTYIQTGGSIFDARRHVQKQIRNLERVIEDIDSYNRVAEPKPHSEASPPNRAGADTEPVPQATPLPQRGDAQIQGDEA